MWWLLGLACWCGHNTATIYGETIALVGCRRCGDVESWWKVLRPEQLIAAQQAHAAVMRDREKRAAAMTPERPKLVRMR